MTKKSSSQVERPVWSSVRLAEDLRIAIDEFRRERLVEPVEEYSEAFDRARDVMETLIEGTVDLDLGQLRDKALELVQDKDMLRAIRYLAGPPISEDDLKTLIDTNSLTVSALERDPDIAARLIQTIRDGLDRGRFPWVAQDRDPTDAELYAAIIGSAALLAARKVETDRRTKGKSTQESFVCEKLLEYGLVEIKIPGNVISNLGDAPKPGQFCSREVTVGTRKADLTVGLWDGRIMPIECKVSNSSTNSVKRLNNDAAVKAVTWISDFGSRNVVPSAVLGGVYKLHNLEEAQRRGLAIFWAHNLDAMVEWIESTR